jgi:hypothetical protein
MRENGEESGEKVCEVGGGGVRKMGLARDLPQFLVLFGVENNKSCVIWYVSVSVSGHQYLINTTPYWHATHRWLYCVADEDGNNADNQ